MKKKLPDQLHWWVFALSLSSRCSASCWAAAHHSSCAVSRSWTRCDLITTGLKSTFIWYAFEWQTTYKISKDISVLLFMLTASRLHILKALRPPLVFIFHSFHIQTFIISDPAWLWPFWRAVSAWMLLSDKISPMKRVIAVKCQLLWSSFVVVYFPQQT